MFRVGTIVRVGCRVNIDIVWTFYPQRAHLLEFFWDISIPRCVLTDKETLSTCPYATFYKRTIFVLSDEIGRPRWRYFVRVRICCVKCKLISQVLSFFDESAQTIFATNCIFNWEVRWGSAVVHTIVPACRNNSCFINTTIFNRFYKFFSNAKWEVNN